MFSIEINGTTYPLRFGMGFFKELNGRISVPIDGLPGVEQKSGINFIMANVVDGDIEALEQVLFVANKTEQPRLDMNILDGFIEDENTNIEEVFDRVEGFFAQANVTRRAFKDLKKAVEAKKANL